MTGQSMHTGTAKLQIGLPLLKDGACMCKCLRSVVNAERPGLIFIVTTTMVSEPIIISIHNIHPTVWEGIQFLTISCNF